MAQASTSSAAKIVVCPNCGKKNRLRSAGRGVAKCGSCHLPLPWLVEASESDFGLIVEQSSLPVLVEFWAPWCGPCRLVAPALEAASVKHAGRLKVVKVNVDQSPNVAQRFGAMSIPLMVLVRDGSELDRLVGAVPAPQLERWLSDRLVAA